MIKNSFIETLSYAERLLAVKDRTKKEIEERLRAKGYDKECTAEVVEYLRQKGFINDKKFVREWLKASSTHRLKGILAVKNELYKRGINEALINDALKDDDIGYDEHKIAKALIEKRSKTIKGADGVKGKR
ncbi:MAG: regulatory protein RecX, partial [Candidatus Omnitrophota bacterium]